MDLDRFTLNKEDSLLLVVDIQGNLAESMTFKHQVYHNTEILLKIAGELGLPVIATEQYPKGLGATLPRIKEKLADAGGQIIEKICFSACEDELIEELKKRGKKQIIITGMETHICVFQTVRDLLKMGYQIFLAKDAISSRYSLNYHNALEMMRDMGAVVSNTETIFFDLLKKAGTKEFKAVASLVR